jgi:hypothetical protein
MVISFVLGWSLAGAQEPGEEADVEVIVYGQLLVEQARNQLVQDLAEAGYEQVKEKGDRVIYRHPSVWRGEVHIHEDGWYQTKRQKVKFQAIEMPWAKAGSPLAVAGCVVYAPLCFRPGGALVGARKFSAQETRVVDHIHEDASVWAERISDLATERTIETLPDRLEALWVQGQPLEGGEVLESARARRKALFLFWDSRTNTRWGDAVRQSVEAFCRAVVQASDDPFTAHELAAFNAQRLAIRPFTLTKSVVETRVE